jgi:hypothetical protein
MERYVDSSIVEDGTNRMMTAEVGLPASRAMVAFIEERYRDVVELLFPRRTRFQRFGGSHAQRDLLERTLTEAAIRDGQLDLARALLDERLSLRPTSVFGLLGRARVRGAAGDEAGAREATTLAENTRARFAAASTG